MQKITGIGGVTFKAKDPKKLMEWYDQHLGIQFQYGFIQFKWSEDGNPNGSTTFSVVKEDSAHFAPSEKPFLINFRVTDLRALLKELQENGVTIVGEIQEYDFGLFGHILDPEGNKLELWQPMGD
jgi:predicted enzyme related to lactoylglutathione lyase